MSRRFCCVYGCTSQHKRDKNTAFHKFPRKGEIKVPFTNKLNIVEKVDRRKMWIMALKMGKPVSNCMTVCSKHFTESDYLSVVKGENE